MDRLGLHLSLCLQEFSRDYLSTPEDRRRVGETLLNNGAMLALFLVAAVVLWLL